MFRVAREIEFCYGHRLLDYEGKCRYLHGHNARVKVVLDGEHLDQRGMLFDFGEIKRVVAQWVDETLDHRMVLRRDDPAVDALRELGEPLVLLDVNPTAENLAKLIFEYVSAQGFPVTEVRFWETPRCCAAYCPGGPDTPIIEVTSLSAAPLERAAGLQEEDEL
jgi:6-pyruvoyltetrahydropterin/6-carboxytetrahydropterin synthase